MIRKKQLDPLRPYLVGEAPVIRGEDEHREWDMFCPLHVDKQRSAGINLDAGVWSCMAGCGGGTVTDLLGRRDEWVDPPSERVVRAAGSRRSSSQKEEVDDRMVRAWARILMGDRQRLEELMVARGLSAETIERHEIGWDAGRGVYTIPVRDSEGALANVRRYKLGATSGRKIWSVNGMGSPRLYPLDSLRSKSIVICEGEWDALITSQHGFPAITRTGAAKVWKSEWNALFRGKVVYLCHDMDSTGQDANRKLERELANFAKDVRVVDLPYKVVEKHGKDLTDFFLEYGREDFLELVKGTTTEKTKRAEKLDPSDASVIDSFDARRVGDPMALTVTVKGRKDPGYSVPREVALSCSRDAGEKCAACPLHSQGGEDLLVVAPNDPTVLELIGATKGQIREALSATYGVPSRCPKLTVDTLEHQSVEVLFARPSVEHSGGSHDAYKNVKLTSVGRHDTRPNSTVRAVGALYPDPRSQLNEFLAWDVEPLETSVDVFELSALTARKLKRFRPKPGQSPMEKAEEIADAMSEHVTKIYGRPEMHLLMDLTWHSVQEFQFADQMISKGWLDVLVVGDTRTGKSEAASKMSNYYRAGEMVSCETASFAGIVGGLQQLGGGKEWAITWGTIPLNDRRLVILDEISGLSQEEIAATSSVRSSGVAELNKIQQERTHARTRLIWLGNPRNSRMSDYTYGVDAIAPLIGNAEDIARFDVAMSVRAGEVSPEEINRAHYPGNMPYTTAMCHALTLWAWSRKAEDVVWAEGAEAAVYEAANDMGRRYVEYPPLVQAANVRVKIARLSVALAARLFSSDASGQKVIVRREHVLGAVEFLDRVYGMPNFGYLERSKEAIGDIEDAKKAADEVAIYIASQKGLAKLLRSNSSFRRQDLEEVLNVPREEANGIINALWEARMVRKVRGDVRVEPSLHELLRRIK